MPEELVILHNALKRGLSLSIADLPTADTPVEATCKFSAPDIKAKAEIELTLADESQKNYIADPQAAKALLQPGKKSILAFKVQAKGKVRADHDTLFPPLKFKCKYRIAAYEGSVPSRSVLYRPQKDSK